MKNFSEKTIMVKNAKHRQKYFHYIHKNSQYGTDFNSNVESLQKSDSLTDGSDKINHSKIYIILLKNQLRIKKK